MDAWLLSFPPSSFLPPFSAVSAFGIVTVTGQWSLDLLECTIWCKCYIISLMRQIHSPSILTWPHRNYWLLQTSQHSSKGPPSTVALGPQVDGWEEHKERKHVRYLPQDTCSASIQFPLGRFYWPPRGWNPNLWVHTETYGGDGFTVARTWLFYDLRQGFGPPVFH